MPILLLLAILLIIAVLVATVTYNYYNGTRLLPYMPTAAPLTDTPPPPPTLIEDKPPPPPINLDNTKVQPHTLKGIRVSRVELQKDTGPLAVSQIEILDLAGNNVAPFCALEQSSVTWDNNGTHTVAYMVDGDPLTYTETGWDTPALITQGTIAIGHN